jgi:hypothetical protein
LKHFFPIAKPNPTEETAKAKPETTKEATKETTKETTTETRQERKPKVETARVEKQTEKKQEVAQTEKKTKKREIKEKTEEQLARERQRAEELSVFTKAVEAKDVATAFEEFSKYVAADKFIPPTNVSVALDFFEENKAWDEATKAIALLLRRGLDSQLYRRHRCVCNILDNTKPEVVRELAEHMKPDTKKKFKIESRLLNK